MEEGTIAIALPADVRLAHAALLHGRRLARDLGLSWTALFIERRRGSNGTVPLLTALVRAHGGCLRHIAGDDVVSALLDLSRAAHAHLLVIAPSRRPRFLRRLIRGTTERLLESSRPFPVVVAGQEAIR